MITDKEIKDCPFCGCKGFVERESFGECRPVYYYRIKCTGLEQHCLDCWDDTADEAVETWNKRTET